MLSSWCMYEMHLALFLKAGCDNVLAENLDALKCGGWGYL
jgi:hypothetical protein